MSVSSTVVLLNLDQKIRSIQNVCIKTGKLLVSVVNNNYTDYVFHLCIHFKLPHILLISLEDCQLGLYYRTYLKRVGDGVDGNHMLSSIVL